MSWWFRIDLWKRVMVGLALGAITGLLLRQAMGPEAAGANVTAWAKPIGDAFINLIKMLVVPLIFTTLVSGVLAMGDPKKLGSLGGRALALYMCTTLIAVSFGLLIGSIIQPGAGFDTNIVNAADMDSARAQLAANPQPGSVAEQLMQTILSIIPTNPVAAMANGDVLPIIFFAIMFGMGILACALHMFFTYGSLVKFVLRLPLFAFFRGAVDAQAVAFSTSSSNATLPMTMSCATENLGISKPIASSVLPLGATINMDGTALYQGLIALFAAQALGLPMTASMYFTIAIMATLVSIGTAGIPSVSLFLAATTLSVVGVSPDQTVLIIALLFPFDRILDMMRTVTNVTGDLAVATTVAKWEGELDEDVFRARDPV